MNYAASDLPAPRFFSDSIEVRSMADGKMYTSKSRLRADYKARGVQEIGNEKPPEKREFIRPPSVRDDLRRTYEQMK